MTAAAAALLTLFTAPARHDPVARPAVGDRGAATRRAGPGPRPSRKQGVEALSRGFLAVAAGDGSEARRLAQKASSWPRTPRPWSGVLAAQAAEAAGDHVARAPGLQRHARLSGDAPGRPARPDADRPGRGRQGAGPAARRDRLRPGQAPRAGPGARCSRRAWRRATGRRPWPWSRARWTARSSRRWSPSGRGPPCWPPPPPGSRSPTIPRSWPRRWISRPRPPGSSPTSRRAWSWPRACRPPTARPPRPGP